MSKIFLAMSGATVPFKPPKQKGANPPSGNPLCNFSIGGGAEKVITFYINISQTKNSVWDVNMEFFTV
jgi:hypothetical protein